MFPGAFPLRRSVLSVVAVLAALTALLVAPATVAAHTGFGASTPSDGAQVDEPVELVTISFTGEASPVGEEFVALTADGVIQEPVDVSTLDDMLFTLRFDPPLAGGRIGVRWTVQAADSHPIEGAFSFTVAAPVPTTAAPTTVPAATAAAVPVTTAPPPTTAPPTTDTTALDEFLAVDGSVPGQTTATVGRLIGFLGVTVGLGAFALLATALRGRRREIRRVVSAVRLLGLVVAVGAVIEYVGVTRIGAESLASGWSTATGFATLLRLVGGLGLALGVSGAVSRGRVQRVLHRPSTVRSLSAAVVHDAATVADGRHDNDGPIVRWSPDAASWPALAGTALIIASFWFDGHTASKGFRPLHALINSVHVAAGAVWVGGVVTVAAVVWSRHRAGQPMRVVELLVRFSRIASISLAAVVVAGMIMAFLVLDSFGELTGTTWGQILLLKSSGVALAAIGGAYNHVRLLPALDADPDSPDLLAGLRSTLIAEAILLLFVVSVTAWLVAAAS